MKTGDVMAFSIAKDGALASVGNDLPSPALRPITTVSVRIPLLWRWIRRQISFRGGPDFFQRNGSAACPAKSSERNSRSRSISAFPVSSGTLGLRCPHRSQYPPVRRARNIPQLHRSRVSPTRLNYVYVTDAVNNTVVGFAFDATIGAHDFGAWPVLRGGQNYRARCFLRPRERFSTWPMPAQTTSTSSSSTPMAVLMPISNTTSTISDGVGPIAMLTDPNAKYLYALANGGSQITGYTMNHVTGALTACGANGGTVSTGANPVAFTIRSDGSTSGNFWVFTSNFGSNTVSTMLSTGRPAHSSPLPQLTCPVAPYGIAAR